MSARELLRILSSAKQIKAMKQLEIMKTRISETLEKKYVDWIDSQIETAYFRNRSPAAEFALVKPLERERME